MLSAFGFIRSQAPTWDNIQKNLEELSTEKQTPIWPLPRGISHLWSPSKKASKQPLFANVIGFSMFVCPWIRILCYSYGPGNCQPPSPKHWPFSAAALLGGASWNTSQKHCLEKSSSLAKQQTNVQQFSYKPHVCYEISMQIFWTCWSSGKLPLREGSTSHLDKKYLTGRGGFLSGFSGSGEVAKGIT